MRLEKNNREGKQEREQKWRVKSVHRYFTTLKVFILFAEVCNVSTGFAVICFYFASETARGLVSKNM